MDEVDISTPAERPVKPIELKVLPHSEETHETSVLLTNFELVQVVSNWLFNALAWMIVLLRAVTFIPQRFFSAPPYVAPIVLLIGVVGAFVSLQRRLKRLPVYDLQLLANSWRYVCLSPFVGGLLATVLYVLFLSQMVTGPLFPIFEKSLIANEVSGNGLLKLFLSYSDKPQEYAKLIVWAFLAGFSEKFVINILGKFETKGPTS